MCATMSSRDGFLLSASSVAACMIWPDWQQPHCGTCSTTQAFCSGGLPSADNPSIVVTDLPATSDSGIAHERTASPSICTVQAPQAAMPQPNLVPVSLRCSRFDHSSGLSGPTATSVLCSFREQ